MKGWTLIPPDRSSPAKSSEVEKPTTVIDIFSSEWTNEKHSLYLNSIEASFVNQLYCSEHLSSGLMGWLSSAQKKSSSAHSNSYKQQSGQLKVLSQDCQEKLHFQMAKNKENNNSYFLANTRVRHFISHTNGKLSKTSCDIDENESACQSINFNTPMEAGKTSVKKLSTCYPFVSQQDIVNTRIEGSDQNFVDLEYELAEATSKASSKKRLRPAFWTTRDSVSSQSGPSSKFCFKSFDPTLR